MADRDEQERAKQYPYRDLYIKAAHQHVMAQERIAEADKINVLLNSKLAKAQDEIANLRSENERLKSMFEPA